MRGSFKCTSFNVLDKTMCLQNQNIVRSDAPTVSAQPSVSVSPSAAPSESTSPSESPSTSPPTPTPPNPPTPPAPGFNYSADHGEDSRLIAYVGNWQTCPTDEQVDAYSHMVIAFAVSYTWDSNQNICDDQCNLASSVPICENQNRQDLVDSWRAKGKKIILSFGGAGMGGSWSGRLVRMALPVSRTFSEYVRFISSQCLACNVHRRQE